MTKPRNAEKPIKLDGLSLITNVPKPTLAQRFDRGLYKSSRRDKSNGSGRHKEFCRETIIGIAIDAPKFSRRNSEDFILVDCPEWPEETRLHYERANDELNFFGTQSVSRQVKVQEFPTASRGRENSPSRVKIGRNEPCPCGSGRKFKKCCLRTGAG